MRNSNNKTVRLGSVSRERLSRREFLGAMGTLAAAGIVLLGPHSWAASIAGGGRAHKRLIVIFLRGAVDGLSVVAPYGDPEYYAARPTIALPRRGDSALLDLDGRFGLHPALAPLISLWRARTLAFVHACGSPDPTRSHFDAQDYMESGTPGVKTTPDGWLNRVIAAMPNRSATEALNLGPTIPRIFSGRMPVATLALGRSAARPQPLDNPHVEAAFDPLYVGGDSLSRAYQEGRIARVELLRELRSDMAAADNGAPPPEGFPGDAARLAELIRRDETIQLAFMSLGGWDTHVNQGAARGQLANHLAPLAEGLAGFAGKLGQVWADTVVLVISEFGRTVHENGNGGTDHGHGNVMWLMGGGIRGGRVYADWPGLGASELYQERDLAITTDFRAPITQALTAHLGLSDAQIGQVFPGWTANSNSLERLFA